MTLITISSAPIGDVTPLYSHVTKLTSLLLLNHVRGGPRWDDLFFTRCICLVALLMSAVHCFDFSLLYILLSRCLRIGAALVCNGMVKHIPRFISLYKSR